MCILTKCGFERLSGALIGWVVHFVLPPDDDNDDKIADSNDHSRDDEQEQGQTSNVHLMWTMLWNCVKTENKNQPPKQREVWKDSSLDRECPSPDLHQKASFGACKFWSSVKKSDAAALYLKCKRFKFPVQNAKSGCCTLAHWDIHLPQPWLRKSEPALLVSSLHLNLIKIQHWWRKENCHSPCRTHQDFCSSPWKTKQKALSRFSETNKCKFWWMCAFRNTELKKFQKWLS